MNHRSQTGKRADVTCIAKISKRAVHVLPITIRIVCLLKTAEVTLRLEVVALKRVWNRPILSRSLHYLALLTLFSMSRACYSG